MSNARRIILPRTITEKLLYSTLRISGDKYIGTGFFYHIQIGEHKILPLILTNKHVIQGNNKLSISFHEGDFKNNNIDPTNRSFMIDIENLSSYWIQHPNDAVDLGAILFDPIKKLSKEILKKEIFSISFDESLIKSDDVLAEESDVDKKKLMIGYPNGLWDETNNFPIVRNGITASHPALDFNGESIGVIDMAYFPGSSGSPIIINMIDYFDKSGTYHIASIKTILLGLLSSLPIYTQSGKLEIKEIPTLNTAPVVTYNQMIHLGYYVKAKEIITLCTHIKKTSMPYN